MLHSKSPPFGGLFSYRSVIPPLPQKIPRRGLSRGPHFFTSAVSRRAFCFLGQRSGETPQGAGRQNASRRSRARAPACCVKNRMKKECRAGGSLYKRRSVVQVFRKESGLRNQARARAAPRAAQAVSASASGAPLAITGSQTIFAPVSWRSADQIRIHSPSPQP